MGVEGKPVKTPQSCIFVIIKQKRKLKKGKQFKEKKLQRLK